MLAAILKQKNQHFKAYVKIIFHIKFYLSNYFTCKFEFVLFQNCQDVANKSYEKYSKKLNGIYNFHLDVPQLFENYKNRQY